MSDRFRWDEANRPLGKEQFSIFGLLCACMALGKIKTACISGQWCEDKAMGKTPYGTRGVEPENHDTASDCG